MWIWGVVFIKTVKKSPVIDRKIWGDFQEIHNFIWCDKYFVGVTIEKLFCGCPLSLFFFYTHLSALMSCKMKFPLCNLILCPMKIFLLKIWFFFLEFRIGFRRRSLVMYDNFWTFLTPPPSPSSDVFVGVTLSMKSDLVETPPTTIWHHIWIAL